jgi:hypothetical protein
MGTFRSSRYAFPLRVTDVMLYVKLKLRDDYHMDDRLIGSGAPGDELCV